MSRQIKFTCPKCGSGNYETRTIRTSGSLLTSIMDIQNRKFDAVICSNCMYTELYYVPPRKKAEM